MKAVILAAGMGIRLRPITNEIPKAFLEVDGIPLIIRSLDCLNDLKIKNVIIVIGYLANYFKKKIGKRYKNLKITYVFNPKYSITGSMYSLSQTEGIIDEDIVLLESDLLYERRALLELINSNESNEILIAPLSGSGDEVYICLNENKELFDLGKNINDKQNTVGELVGISKLSLDFVNKLYKIAKQDYQKNDNKYHYEEVLLRVSKNYPIKCKLINDLDWIEIDNIYDLKRAKEIIYPKIKEKEINDG